MGVSMEINFSARSRHDNDSLARMAKIMDDNTDLFVGKIDAHSNAIQALYLTIQAQAELIDSLNEKVNYLYSNLKFAINGSLPPKRQVDFMSRANKAEREAKECYERIAKEILADYGQRIKKLEK